MDHRREHANDGDADAAARDPGDTSAAHRSLIHATFGPPMIAPRLLAALVLLVVTALGGCALSPSTTDAGGVDDAAPEICELDLACAESAPVWGGPCAGALVCAYPASCAAGTEDQYECVGGGWSLTVPAPCRGRTPALTESCLTPFAGTLAGARVVITEDRPGAPPLADGDRVELALGTQGLAMIPYRVRVEGTEAPPTCANVSALVTLEGVSATRATHPARLRCGGSLRIQDILPENPCDPRLYAITLQVTVIGVGEQTVSLMAMGLDCAFGP